MNTKSKKTVSTLAAALVALSFIFVVIIADAPTSEGASDAETVTSYSDLVTAINNAEDNGEIVMETTLAECQADPVLPENVMNALKNKDVVVTFQVSTTYNNTTKVYYEYTIDTSVAYPYSPDSASVNYLVGFNYTDRGTIGNNTYVKTSTIALDMNGDYLVFGTQVALNLYSIGGAGVEGSTYTVTDSNGTAYPAIMVDSENYLTIDVSAADDYKFTVDGDATVESFVDTDDRTQRIAVSIIIVTALVLGVGIVFRRF